METNLSGRLRNTPFPESNPLMPLFEAIINSIQAIDELDPTKRSNHGHIRIDIVRDDAARLALDEGKTRKDKFPPRDITGFRITDDGAGFHDASMKSFNELDSAYKAHLGGRGIGRLSWLHAFGEVNVRSTFRPDPAVENKYRREFTFSKEEGVQSKSEQDVECDALVETVVALQGLRLNYRKKVPAEGKTIAIKIIEHCFWYFMRPQGLPDIHIHDGIDTLSLSTLFADYAPFDRSVESLPYKRQTFEITHMKLRNRPERYHGIVWCAAGRVVDKTKLSGKVAGLFNKKLRDADGEYFYGGQVTSAFLDNNVSAERGKFNIASDEVGLFAGTDIGWNDLQTVVTAKAEKYLEPCLKEGKEASRERVHRFIDDKGVRYRPVLSRMRATDLLIDPDISDADLDVHLHKLLTDIESRILEQGHNILTVREGEDYEGYRERLTSYLAEVDDVKKSDLANYVSHRRVILELLEKAIQRGPDGAYCREDVIHDLIMPRKKETEDLRRDDGNFWLIDERLAFHHYLASDKSLESMPVTNSESLSRPDLLALSIYDKPLLISEKENLPLSTIVVVEIKRPMRSDGKPGTLDNPIMQALDYLEKVRTGGMLTRTGRPIPACEDTPGFCYIICDLAPPVVQQCKLMSLTITADKLGYFGFLTDKVYNAYVEVISFDRLLNMAKERNKAFFDRLGLPSR